MARNQERIERIRQHLERQHPEWLRKDVVAHIAKLCNRSEWTVWRWFTESQDRPIPDTTLELLEFKLGLRK